MLMLLVKICSYWICFNSVNDLSNKVELSNYKLSGKVTKKINNRIIKKHLVYYKYSINFVSIQVNVIFVLY